MRRRTKDQINRDRFEGFRARYLAAVVRLDEASAPMRARCGYHQDWRQWITRAEGRRLEALHGRVDAAADRLLKHIETFSPRDWRSGTPAHWVYEKLTYEDAARPRSERLSVVPPLAYGHSKPIT